MMGSLLVLVGPVNGWLSLSPLSPTGSGLWISLWLSTTFPAYPRLGLDKGRLEKGRSPQGWAGVCLWLAFVLALFVVWGGTLWLRSLAFPRGVSFSPGSSKRRLGWEPAPVESGGFCCCCPSLHQPRRQKRPARHTTGCADASRGSWLTTRHSVSDNS